MKRPEPKSNIVIEKQLNEEALNIYFVTEAARIQICREASAFGNVSAHDYHAVLSVNLCYDIGEVAAYLQSLIE